MIIEFGDNVRFVDNSITRDAGVALMEGACMGYTTPSMTKIEFLGETDIDYAISVKLKDNSEIIWATQDLVEFLDHGEGQVIEAGNKRLTRRADGSWKEEIIDPDAGKSNWFKKVFSRK